MNRDRVRQIANVIAVIGTIAFNSLSQSLRLNGNTNAELANRYPIFYFPANAAFSIWGIIFTLWIVWAVYQALPSQRDNPNQQKIGYLFVLSCLGNIGWLIAFHYEQFVLSMLPILFLLATLILIYLRLAVGKAQVSLQDKLFIHVPFSVYLGWVTAAVVTNTTYVLYHEGFRESFLGINAEAWAVILFIISAGLGITALLTRRDIAYALVIVWALGFIGLRYQETDLIGICAFIMAGITFAGIVLSIFIHPFGNQPIRNFNKQSA